MARNFDIAIDNGNVMVKEYTNSFSMKLNDLAKELVQADNNIETPQLPLNTVKYKSVKEYNYYYIAVPQGPYNVMYGRRGVNAKKYLVYFPHMVFIFKFNKANGYVNTKLVWSSNNQLDVNDSSFTIPPLNNVHGDGGICTGTWNSGETPSQTVDNYISMFFENVFNDDISGGKRGIVSVASEQAALSKAGKTDMEMKQAWYSGLGTEFTKKFTINSFLKGDY